MVSESESEEIRNVAAVLQSIKTAQDEMFISYNGPEIGESDWLLSEALSKHFKQNNLLKMKGKLLVRS